jgi:hypothetical protein
MACHEHRRVAQIVLAGLDAAVEIDFPKPECIFTGGRRIVEQRAESGIAVDARSTAPDEAPGAIDERGNLAISDRPKI